VAEDDELERRVRQLEHDHRLTRWYTGRVDRDLAEIAATQAEHTELLTGLVTVTDSITTTQTEHAARFDSLDAQMRSLTQMIGEVLRRLPDPDIDDEGRRE
jgi:adenosyl cobinamide kinase/adenosyl cobinamide phosphate guanylyltransferase